MLELIKPDPSQENPEQAELNKLARRWHTRIRKEKREHDEFRKQAKDAWETYLDSGGRTTNEYPLLWSVISIEHAATYSSRPVPVVKPRNSSRNPAYKSASDVMERGLEFVCDQTEIDETLHRATDDYLVAGLSVPRVKLDAEIEEIPALDEMGQPITGEDGEPLTEPYIKDQSVRAEYVPWSRFGWEPATSWDHTGWIYFRHPLSKAEIKKRYGSDASFGASDYEYTSENNRSEKQETTYWVYEIWDKESRQVIHLAEGGMTPLQVDDDPLGVSGFFPCPPPIMTNVEYDRLVPKPDYCLIECFADELTRLYKRRRALTEAIKAITFHDSSIVELEDFTTVEDNTSIAIDNIAERLESGSLDRMILPWPIKEKVEALGNVNQQIELVRRQVDGILGIGDILQGASNPQDGQETQKIKERWAGIRLRRKQIALQHQIRNLFRIMTEVMVEHFTRENLSRMTQVEIDDETWAVLQDDMLREFSVDIETDSTVAKDEFQDKRERTELLNAMTQYVQTVAPAAMQNIIPGDLAAEILKIAVQPYSKQARGLDQIIDQLPSTQKQLQSIQQMQGQVQQQGQQIEQMQYALAQYSQAEEQRKNAETQAKAAQGMATAQEKMAGIQDKAAQAGETQADTRKTIAETQKILHEMQKPCGCEQCSAGQPCGCAP